MKTYFHSFRKEILNPRHMTIRKEIVITADDSLTKRESRLLAEKIHGETAGFSYQGGN